MGLLTFSINVTLDGCVDHQEGIADDETHAFFTRLMDEGGAMLWGRVTYEMMESYWPAVASGDEEAPPAMREWAVKLGAKPKYVVSSTRKDFPWTNSHHIAGDLREGVQKLKDATPAGGLLALAARRRPPPGGRGRFRRAGGGLRGCRQRRRGSWPLRHARRAGLARDDSGRCAHGCRASRPRIVRGRWPFGASAVPAERDMCRPFRMRRGASRRGARSPRRRWRRAAPAASFREWSAHTRRAAAAPA